MAKILIGVTGGIAAYKVADITSVLTQQHHEVRIIMTENAKKFITPLTLATLSKNPVFDDSSEWTADGTIKHIELSKWADVFVIVPATANTISKFAQCIADNLLTSTYSVFNIRTPFKNNIIVCPAMNTNMWDRRCFQSDLEILQNNHYVKILKPIEGLLACGDIGLGKLPQTKDIIKYINDFLEIEVLKMY